MTSPIYYSQFRFETWGYANYRLVCNVTGRELYYQVLDYPCYVEKEKVLCRERIVSQKAMILTDEDVENLKPYINALDFEPYRHRKENWSDEGVKCIMDGCHMDFYGITDSYLPLIKIQMTVSYWDPWPTERLLGYIGETFEQTGRLKPV